MCLFFFLCPFLSNPLADLDKTWQEGGYCLCLYESSKTGSLVTQSTFYIIKNAFQGGFKHVSCRFLSNRLASFDQTWHEGGYC